MPKLQPRSLPRPNRIASVHCLLFALVATMALGGCSTSLQHRRFPDFYAAPAPEGIDLVVDVTVLNDLEGDDLGIDLARNSATAEHARERTEGTLRNAGYAVNVARSGHGLTWLTPSHPTYIAVNGIATGTPYTGPLADGSDPWTENEARNFLYMLARTGRTRFRDARSVAAHEEFAALAHMPDPRAFAQLQTRYLMLMNVLVYDQPALKEFGSTMAAVAVAATLIASANVYLMPAFRDSYTFVNVALYDKETETVVWAFTQLALDDGPGDLEAAIGCALMTLPVHEGGRARYPNSGTSCF